MGSRYSPTWFAAAFFGAAEITHTSALWLDALAMHGVPESLIAFAHASGTVAFVIVSVKAIWHLLPIAATVLMGAATAITWAHTSVGNVGALAFSASKGLVLAGLLRFIRWLRRR
jgi:hypothetical protein